MASYLLIYSLPFINNFAYFFILGTLLLTTLFLEKSIFKSNRALRTLYRIIITILFLRFLLEVTLVFSQNLPPESPAIGYYLVQSAPVYLIAKAIVVGILLGSAIYFAVISRKMSSSERAFVMPLMIFIILQCVVEIGQRFNHVSREIAYLLLIASFANIVPLTIWLKKVINLYPKRRFRFRAYFINSIFAFFAVTVMGVVVLTTINSANTRILNADEALIRNSLQTVEVNDYSGLASKVDKINDMTPTEIYLVRDPDLLLPKHDLFTRRVMYLENQDGYSLVFGLPYSIVHVYLGKTLRFSIMAIVSFCFIMGIGFSLNDRRKE